MSATERQQRRRSLKKESNMHVLEYLLFTTAVAVERDEISKAELVRVLGELAGGSHNYAPENEHSEEPLLPLHREFHRRFDRLLGASEPRTDHRACAELLAGMLRRDGEVTLQRYKRECLEAELTPSTFAVWNLAKAGRLQRNPERPGVYSATPTS
jgi:hypothetical protein